MIRTIDYAHPVFTREGMRAQAPPRARSRGADRIHFCGAYWGWGFHEDGLQSGLRVAAVLRAGSGARMTDLYVGTVRHRRFAVRDNEFSHKVAYGYVDLEALPARAAGPSSFRPRRTTCTPSRSRERTGAHRARSACSPCRALRA